MWQFSRFQEGFLEQYSRKYFPDLECQTITGHTIGETCDSSMGAHPIFSRRGNNTPDFSRFSVSVSEPGINYV